MENNQLSSRMSFKLDMPSVVGVSEESKNEILQFLIAF